MLFIKGTISYYLAKGIVKFGPEVRKEIETDKALAKQIDELLEESKKVVDELDLMSKPSKTDETLEGKILNHNELANWANKLKLKYGSNFELVESFSDKSVLAQFIAETNTIRYKKGATNYQIFHESLHAEECFLIGKVEYLKGSKQYGGTLREQIKRTYEREKYVYERIKLNAKEQGFNVKELEHNQLLFDWHTYNLKHFK